MASKVFGSPGRFIVGQGEIGRLGEYVKRYGGSALLVAIGEDADRVGPALKEAEDAGVTLHRVDFGGECTMEEINRIKALFEEKGADVVIGLGGGKAIDTAKCVARLGGYRPLIIVPTIASTDAPCSAMAIIYNDEHAVVGYEFFTANPDMVIADSGVIANAPPHFLAAGIGDAYATYFEARTCMDTYSSNFMGGVSTRAAFALATLCRDILLEDGEKALAACRAKTVTPALENVIEANLLLSGLGFESVGTAAAHSLHDALTVLPETHRVSHGEKVAIGLLAQHVMENESLEQIGETIGFFKKIGLPTKLAQIGIEGDVAEKLKKVAAFATPDWASIHHEPFPVTEETVFSALMAVDTLEDIVAG